MEKARLITQSDEATDPLLECAGHQHQLSQPLRGPSLDNLVDLGISIRDKDDSTEENAFTGIDFRNEDSLPQDHRLDDLKDVENSTHLKIVVQSPDNHNTQTMVKSSITGSAASSSEPEDPCHTEDEIIVASVSSVGTRENYSSSDLTYMNTPALKSETCTGIAPPLSEGRKYHVFFSYEISDREWVKEVAQRLEAPELGFRCSIHERDFHPGKRIIENITEHIRVSEKTVLVLSPEFIQSQWCRFEIELGMVLSMEESQLLLVPVMVKPCDIPDTIKTLTYIDATTGNDWWQRFLDAVTTKDVLLADVVGTRDFTIHPRYENMDFLTEVSSNFKCCSGEAIRTPYIPDVLMRPGIQISVEDFDQAFSNIRSQSRFLCTHCCDITVICVMLFLALLVLAIIIAPGVYMPIIMKNIPHGSVPLAAVFIVLSFSWIVMIVWFFLQRSRRKTKLKRAVKEANKIFLTKNAILGFKAEISACILFKVKLIFWYYNLSECQKHLAAFLQTLREFNTNADVQEICKTRASMLISQHSGEYTAAYMDGKLKPKHGTRHVRNANCICQFIEEKYAGKEIPDVNIIC